MAQDFTVAVRVRVLDEAKAVDYARALVARRRGGVVTESDDWIADLAGALDELFGPPVGADSGIEVVSSSIKVAPFGGQDREDRTFVSTDATVLSLDDLASELGESLLETDSAYVAKVAEKYLGKACRPLSDGDTVRVDGIRHSVGSLVADLVAAVTGRGAAEAVALANEVMTNDYSVGPDGSVLVVARDEPAPGP